MAAMQIWPERICARRMRCPCATAAAGFERGDIRRAALCEAGKFVRDVDVRQGIAECAVMLHLRARYVSKAAILTIPAPRVPVENRSPA
jgi:hypothetical protein